VFLTIQAYDRSVIVACPDIVKLMDCVKMVVKMAGVEDS
jgi:hypothetical protein